MMRATVWLACSVVGRVLAPSVAYRRRAMVVLLLHLSQLAACSSWCHQGATWPL